MPRRQAPCLQGDHRKLNLLPRPLGWHLGRRGDPGRDAESLSALFRVVFPPEGISGPLPSPLLPSTPSFLLPLRPPHRFPLPALFFLPYSCSLLLSFLQRALIQNLLSTRYEAGAGWQLVGGGIQKLADPGLRLGRIYTARLQTGRKAAHRWNGPKLPDRTHEVSQSGSMQSVVSP